ncbi:MAG: hypothetical protein IKK01_00315 [Clostridia bacterium]|nr:hypothetical protein [Clostridia bacterium]
MDIIPAIRELCKGDKGFENMFDKKKSGGKLGTLTNGSRDAELFEALLYGKARSALIEMINDAYNFKEYAVKAHGLLMKDGLSAMDAKRALEIFFTAFGFPGYREMDQSKVSTLSDTVGSDFKVEYEGEVLNGKEHGVGARTCYSHGKWCHYDECVWIDGVMNGYLCAKDLEFSAFEVQKIGFVIDDHEVGKTKCFSGEDEYYDDGLKFNVK